ncbi:MAG: hypothetical protein K9W44_07610 [Candidatus Lokiarchaeota archaeon]|nr:hypothetical protein [Candidatus Harpocratesius repetitus]
MVKINLTEAGDGLNSYWWIRIRSNDFAFQSRITDQEQAEAEEDDIFIHKEILEGDRYPTKRYHIVIDDELVQIDGKVAREILSKKVANYINDQSKLPFQCKFTRVVKTGPKINLYYDPNQSDGFKLTLLSEWIFKDQKEKPIEEIEEFFKSLPQTHENPLSTSGDPTFFVEPVESANIIEQVATESGKNSVYIRNGEITEIDLRKSYYMGHETIFYLLHVKGGTAAPDKKKNSIQKEFEFINAKCSESSMEKYELKVGDIVNFSGKLKNDKKLKILIHNIRKFEKIDSQYTQI